MKSVYRAFQMGVWALVILLFSGLLYPALAQRVVPDTTIVTLSLNKKLSQDFEILQWEDGGFSVPIRYLSQIVDVSAQQTHQSNTVSFRDPATGEPVLVNVDTQTVTLGGQVLASPVHPLVRKTDGLFARDDIYVDEALAEKLLNLALSFDNGSQTVYLEIDRDIRALLALPDGQEGGIDEPDQKSQVIIQEAPEGGRLLETVTLDMNSTAFSESQKVPGAATNFFNSSAQFQSGLRGYIARMPYRFEPRWAFRNGDYGMSDIQWNIEKRGEKNYVQGGSLMTGLSPLVTPFIPLWGVQMSSYNAANPMVNPSSTQEFSGDVTLKGRVYIDVNDFQVASQVPVENHYRFDDVPMQPDTMNKIRIYQKPADGKEVILYEGQVPYYAKTMRTGENAYSLFAGRTPLQFQPPGFGINKFLMPQSNKWVAGGRYFRGITDRLTMGFAAAGDTILGTPETSPFGGLLNTLQIPDLTGYSSYGRDPNFWSGINAGLSLNYRLKDHWLLSADGAGSVRNQYDTALASGNGPLAFAGQAAAHYQRPNFMSNFKLFHYDTDYYTPTTLGMNNLYDREGGAVEASGSLMGFQYQGGLEHYWSNLSDVFAGGKIDINRWDGSLSRRINALTDARFRYTWLDGDSALRALDVKDMQFEVNRLLPHNIRWYISAKRTNNLLTQATLNPFFDNDLALTTRTNNIINLLYTDFQIPLPSDWGSVQVGTNLSKEIKILNLQARFNWKRFVFEPIIQKSFAGEQDLLIAGMGLYYEKDNGQHIGFRYTYNFSSVPILSLSSLNPISIGSTDRGSHQLQFDFTDALSFVGGKLFSLGRNVNLTGFAEGSVFLDLNQNGKQEKDEPGVPNIPVKMNGEHDYQSDGKGRFTPPALYPGTYAFSFDFANLPINLTPTTPTVHAEVKTGQRTQVRLGVIVTPGIISGSVKLHDAAGHPLDPTDMMILLKNTEGKEVQFTYVDSRGRYSLSDLPPGTYQVLLDPKQAEEKHYDTQSAPDKIIIPVDYENFVERKEMNFDVLQLMRLP